MNTEIIVEHGRQERIEIKKGKSSCKHVLYPVKKNPRERFHLIWKCKNCNYSCSLPIYIDNTIIGQHAANKRSGRRFRAKRA